ncbi:MAG: hypothetical protein KAH32_01480 [Chlamydiia bacterium]|nr:hypothetical protein [Chlamydiia bacterium]
MGSNISPVGGVGGASKFTKPNNISNTNNPNVDKFKMAMQEAGDKQNSKQIESSKQLNASNKKITEKEKKSMQEDKMERELIRQTLGNMISKLGSSSKKIREAWGDVN